MDEKYLYLNYFYSNVDMTFGHWGSEKKPLSQIIFYIKSIKSNLFIYVAAYNSEQREKKIPFF